MSLQTEMPAPPAKTMLFSDQNHWRFGWGDGLYNFHEQDKPRWATYGPCRREPKAFDAEVADTARRIAAAATKPLYVAMSGGPNSELVARTMVQERIHFTPLIAQFRHDYNKRDTKFAFAFCTKHNLTPEILKIDVADIFKECADTPYMLRKCTHLLMMKLMRHAASLGGAAVMGASGHRYKKLEGNDKIYLSAVTEDFTLAQFMQTENIEGFPAFFRHTPEIMLSLLTELKTLNFEPMSTPARDYKEGVYRKFWPELAAMPKHSGFESVLRRQRITQIRLRTKHDNATHALLITVDELENQLSKGLNPSSGG